MFRLPKTSNQSPIKKPSNLIVNTVVNTQKNQGLCKFSHRKCNFVCLENYDYCLKHILEDKFSPYKPCPYLYTVSGKKCGNPALRLERKDTWFCAKHNRKSHLQRQRALSRHAPPNTQEALFATLGHYAPPDQPTVKKEEVESEELSGKEDTQTVNPFVDIDATQVNTRVSAVLDYVSDSDSDVDAAMLDSVWRAQDHESSDAESVDSQTEDPLKHAGTYTAEEVTIIIKDKMLRLQSLYIDQFRRLHHLLKEKRRKYLHALKKEKESLCSIHDQDKLTAKEQKVYQKLKALNRYHKHYGVEAVLHKKALERRAQVTEGHQMRISHKGKCSFTEGGVKCGVKTLPHTKFCRKHILEDTQQMLFRPCGVKREDHICREPTLNVYENATCVYHTILPLQPHEKLGKYESKEDQISDEVNTQTLENDSENAFANVDSEDLLIKDILKPVVSTSGKPESIDASELSKTVNDILLLAEDHPDTTEAEKISDNPTIDQNIETSSSDAKNESPCEKMDVEEEQKQPATQSEESAKEECSADLVMIDMMTDVGVVEEVLETEQTVVSSVEEVVCSEQDGEAFEQKTVESEQQVAESTQEVTSGLATMGSGEEVELSGWANENGLEEKMQVDMTNENKPENSDA